MIGLPKPSWRRDDRDQQRVAHLFVLIRQGWAMLISRAGEGQCFALPNVSRRRLSYSYRKATIGSTLVARRAGKYDASRATARRMRATAPKVRGSVALTWNSMDGIKRIRMNAPTRPEMTPTMAVVMDWRSTSRSTLPALAPSAMRTPISRVRRAIE